ncbi:hypothetical protein JB92DRAFT_3117440 [Gautieria morchelliformis]|nr:hypothetical protein JB92DRAFT_3117440 [Gautieria morchelliformis]
MRSHDDGRSYMPQDSTTANTSYPMDDASYSRAYHQSVRSTEVAVDYTVAPSFVQLEDGNLQPGMGMSGVWSGEEGAVYDNVIHEHFHFGWHGATGTTDAPSVAGVYDNMSYRWGSQRDIDDCMRTARGGHPGELHYPVPGAPYSYGHQQQELRRTAREPLIETKPTVPEVISYNQASGSVGSAVDYVEEYAPLSGQGDASHYPLSVSDGSWLSGPPPPQEGAPFPSAGPDCSSTFKQQGLHYIAPDPSSSLTNSACDGMSSSAEGKLRSRSGYDTPFRLSPGLTSLQYIDDGARERRSREPLALSPVYAGLPAPGLSL